MTCTTASPDARRVLEVVRDDQLREVDLNVDGVINASVSMEVEWKLPSEVVMVTGAALLW